VFQEYILYRHKVLFLEILEKIIITGGTGFIGRYLIKKLSNKRQFSVALIANTPNTSGMESSENGLLRFHAEDIRDREAILKIFREERADVCIHLAARISVADSIKNPQETMDINVRGTINVLDACHRSGINNFVFASSAAVYGDVDFLPISENQPLRPLSPYGKSKMLAEQYVMSYKQSKKIKNTISLRIFNVFGHGQTIESDVITRFTKRLSKRQPPIINGEGAQTRDFISVEDVVNAFISAMTVMERDEIKLTKVPPVFNIGTGNPTSIKDLALKMIEIFGLDLQPIYKETKEDDSEIKFSYADITRAKRHLGFVTKKGLEVGLREMISALPSSNHANPHKTHMKT
jgi:UDP-glucose 4-epimerase